MRNHAPEHEELLDHKGNPRAVVDLALSYDQTRLSTAFHEAGHAVLSMACGMHIIKSEIIAWEPETGGWSVTGRTDHEARGVDPWEFAAQCAAGELASLHFLRVHGLWTPERAAACTADHDRELAIDVLGSFGYQLGRDHTPEGGKSWVAVQVMAATRMLRLWDEITAVANAMAVRDVVTGDEIAALTGLVNHPMSGGAA
ncbi:hypothetical protein HET69_09025 [Streptomyces sp. CJ_13]|uniref:hypothetical protein n=1 Tax=Streptomyces sp. CJ_13 TaxID=2724943 RepID=UPI001BDD2DE2|nr:hypothetical protein [Streptomyces sp. CJ_13]MBT1184153.1 hypothetical protein [Streptomyces sp. CJ_13]